MTHSIVYDAIETKTTRFERPASLINVIEVAAAIHIGYRQAGIVPPELQVGTIVEDFRSAFLTAVDGNEGVNPKLIEIIVDYPHEKAEFNELALETYEYGNSLL